MLYSDEKHLWTDVARKAKRQRGLIPKKGSAAIE
jgi:hypothetical protein